MWLVWQAALLAQWRAMGGSSPNVDVVADYPVPLSPACRRILTQVVTEWLLCGARVPG